MRRRNVDESRRSRERELLASNATYADVQRFAAELYRGAVDPFVAGLELDRVLKATGFAGRYYAERLLAMIPRAWRKGPGPRGPDPAHPNRITSPYEIDERPMVTFFLHGQGSEGWSARQIPELIHFVDRGQEYRDKAQIDRFLSRSRINLIKPYLGLNTPDGFGSPLELRASPGATFGSGLRRVTTIGIEIGYRAGLTRRDVRGHGVAWRSGDGNELGRNFIELSGAGDLEARGANYYGHEAFPIGRRFHASGASKLRAGWKDVNFVKMATKLYDALLTRAEILGPVANLTLREEDARHRATGNWPERAPDDYPGDRDYRHREWLNRDLINTVETAGRLAELPEFPWSGGRRSGVNASAFTPEVLARWHQVLDMVIPAHYHPRGEEPTPFDGDPPLDANVL